MDELGIIIDQDGNYMGFGKWRERELRVNENPNDWHDDSFKNTVYYTPWFQNLGIPDILSDTTNFHNQIDKFAQNGIIVIANAKEKSNTPGESRIIMAVPSTITNEQIAYLMSKREDFTTFENGHYSFIDILSTGEEYEVEKAFYHITNFYDYLDKLIKTRKKHLKQIDTIKGQYRKY